MLYGSVQLGEFHIVRGDRENVISQKTKGVCVYVCVLINVIQKISILYKGNVRE